MNFISPPQPAPSTSLPHGALQAICEGRHGDPFAVLGPHEQDGATVVRVFMPGADRLVAIGRDDGAQLCELAHVADGLWEGIISKGRAYKLHITHSGHTWETEDPYSFPPVLGDLDVYLLGEGKHRRLYKVLGAHVTELDGVTGVAFAVWAPNAQRVSVVGDFNSWDGRRNPMRARHGAGVWELFIPRLQPGACYKYEILGPDGTVQPQKADPVAWATEKPPATASVVADPTPHAWQDSEWLIGRAARHTQHAPISIYELHAFSWCKADADKGGWGALADRLIPYIQDLGFTHIELMPIMEHPFGGSWGYQPLGQFAPSARLGSPQQFAAFVDRCHQADIGVILDWVPAHFPTDAHGLAHFDGTSLYEHQDPKEGFHQDWNTLIYNLGRNEVRNFLIASALFWLDHFHIDGLRVDAVASMLYRDYSRKQGEWIPNRYGGRENLESISFLQDLSIAVRDVAPGTLLIAEESTSWPGVTRSAEDGGLGFDFKWNMGWMHDTLEYVHEDPVYRKYHHDKMSFGLVYAFSEKFVLPLSHDEVVHGKGSLWQRMPGDDWQKAANLRNYFGFMWTHPGKKLLFMGGEMGQKQEWNHDQSIDWGCLQDPLHKGLQSLIGDLNRLYRDTPALHVRDADCEGFRWVVLEDGENSVYAFLRFGREGDKPVLVVCNFTPVPRYSYRLGVPHMGAWREILNTDASQYGGSNVGNGGWVQSSPEGSHHMAASVDLTLPPLGTLIFRAE